MPFQLHSVEARVLGALVEKDLATPEYYPLSLNALKNACNQKNNRDPVMNLDEDIVEQALDSLREQKLALMLTGGEHRVPKYAHRISETLNLDNRALAILGVLLLRGPQTLGELRSRTQSLHNFDDLEAVESSLHRLMERDPEALVKQLPRQSGLKEQRYAHLLSGDVVVVVALEPEAHHPPVRGDRDRIAALEAEVDLLKAAIGDIRLELSEFRRQFE